MYEQIQLKLLSKLERFCSDDVCNIVVKIIFRMNRPFSAVQLERMVNGNIIFQNTKHKQGSPSSRRHKRVISSSYACQKPVREQQQVKREKLFESAWLKRLTFDEEVRQANAKKTARARLSAQYRQQSVTDLLNAGKADKENMRQKSPQYLEGSIDQKETIQSKFRTRCSSLRRRNSNVTPSDANFYQKLRNDSPECKPRISFIPSDNYIFEKKKHEYKVKDRGTDKVSLYRKASAAWS